MNNAHSVKDALSAEESAVTTFCIWSGWKGHGNKLNHSTMRIKRHLPKAPFPPTKPMKTHAHVNHGGDITYHGKSPLDTVTSIGQAVTEQSKRNSHAYQSARKAKRWAIIRQMMAEGASCKEMAEETGYTYESVRTAIKKMREAGEILPELKKGPKPKCKE